MNKKHHQTAQAIQVPHGHPVNKYHLYCPECGKNLCGFEIRDSYVCPLCRWSVSKDSRFCGHCGEPLSEPVMTQYWCIGQELERDDFVILVETLKLKKEDVK